MRTLLIFAIAFLSFFASFAEDGVILRNGEETSGKLLMITDTYVSFKGKKNKLVDFKLEDVYCIKRDSREDIFYTRTGERKSMPKNEYQSGCDRIYLVDGEEIIGWGASISGQTLSYRTSKDKQRALSSNQDIPVERVFMVVYSDGSKDVLNKIDLRKPEPEKKEEPAKSEQQLQVIFHNVEKGETVKSIAAKYDVSIEDFRDWNDISSKISNTQRLPVGKQMVIYTKVAPK